jgi:hypothetical protein
LHRATNSIANPVDRRLIWATHHRLGADAKEQEQSDANDAHLPRGDAFLLLVAFIVCYDGGSTDSSRASASSAEGASRQGCVARPAHHGLGWVHLAALGALFLVHGNRS